MTLILRDDRLRLRQLPHLMPQRLGVVAPQRRAAPATLRRLERHDLVALLDGNQWPLVLGMPLLPAAFSFLRRTRLRGRFIRPRRFRMRMLGTRRQRRIPRRLPSRPQLGLQLGHANHQLVNLPILLRRDRQDPRPNLSRQPGWLCNRNRRLHNGEHARHVPDFNRRAKTNSTRSRNRGVNDYNRQYFTR